MIDYSESKMEEHASVDGVNGNVTDSREPETGLKTGSDDSGKIVDVYHGLVDDVPVKEPGYPLFIGFVLVALLFGTFYILGSKEGAYMFSDVSEHQIEASVKDKVKELLDKVARLRAESSYDSAYILLRDFHELHPEEPNVNRELGWHNMQKGLFVFAAEYYELAAEITPTNSRLNYYRGELHLRWGKSEEARTKTGSMDLDTKTKILKTAIDHFQSSSKHFEDSASGSNCFNKDSALAKRLLSRELWFMARFKMISLISMKVLSEGRTSKNKIEEAIDDLDNLLKEDGLPSDLIMQINSRISDLKEEL